MQDEDIRIHRMGEAAQRLLSNADFKVFLESIREQAVDLAEVVMVSGCDTFEDYHRKSGFYAGLFAAMRWAHEASEDLSELLEHNNATNE